MESGIFSVLREALSFKDRLPPGDRSGSEVKLLQTVLDGWKSLEALEEARFCHFMLMKEFFGESKNKQGKMEASLRVSVFLFCQLCR